MHSTTKWNDQNNSARSYQYLLCLKSVKSANLTIIIFDGAVLGEIKSDKSLVENIAANI